MKRNRLCKYIQLITLLVFGISEAVYSEGGKTDLLKGVEHFKQSTVKITGSKIVYFDPYLVSSESHDGDLVFITHTHGDHLSLQDIQKVIKPGGTIIVPSDGVSKVKGSGIDKIIEVAPNRDYEIEGVKWKTVPAYNLNKQFHPKANRWVGYILSLNGVSYYIAGDTDKIPEMGEIQTDVAFLPVGGTYTMNAEEAAQAANIIKPKIAVPIHFGDVVGSVEDAQRFIHFLDKNIEGIILKKN